MAAFKPCLGKSACLEGDEGCRACGRSVEEIERTRQAVASLSELALALGYDNVEEFAHYVARRVVKKVEHARAEEA